MKCMCAQTRPRFILSSEGVLGGMEFEPMLTPREKSPLPENVPRGGSNPRRCGQRAQALPTELFRPPAKASFIFRSFCPSRPCLHSLQSSCLSLQIVHSFVVVFLVSFLLFLFVVFCLSFLLPFLDHLSIFFQSPFLSLCISYVSSARPVFERRL